MKNTPTHILPKGLTVLDSPKLKASPLPNLPLTTRLQILVSNLIKPKLK